MAGAIKLTVWRPSSIAAGLLCAVMWPAGMRAQAPIDEYRVKAAFIFHFVQLVEWPSEAMKSETAPLSVCVLGDDPFHGVLEESMDGKSVGARPVRVSHPRESRDVHGCHVLFIGESESKRISALLSEAKDAPVLTIGDSEDFVLQSGGMIGFCLENNRVRFDVNVVAASRARIKISSRLLLLAKVVIGNRGLK